MREWVTTLLVMLSATQVDAGMLRLTVDEAVARAISVNSQLGASRKDIDAATATLHRSRALFPSNPILTGGLQRTVQAQGQNYGVSLQQEVEIANQRSQRIDVAEAGVEKATWEVKHAEIELAATVKTAYARALVGADRVALELRSVDAGHDLTNDAAEKPLKSTESRIDFNTVLMQESRARRDLLVAQQGEEEALGNLRYLLGLPGDQPIELAGSLQTEVKELPPGPELVARALEKRADLVASRNEQERTKRQVSLSWREAIPNLTLSGSITRFEGHTFGGGDVSVPIPLFTHSASGQDVLEATAERERTARQLTDLERTIERDVLQARRACTVASAGVRIYQQEILPKSEQNLELERGLYDSGQVTSSDMLGIMIDVLGARREYLDALLQYNEALIDLERVTGGTL